MAGKGMFGNKKLWASLEREAFRLYENQTKVKVALEIPLGEFTSVVRVKKGSFEVKTSLATHQFVSAPEDYDSWVAMLLQAKDAFIQRAIGQGIGQTVQH